VTFATETCKGRTPRCPMPARAPRPFLGPPRPRSRASSPGAARRGMPRRRPLLERMDPGVRLVVNAPQDDQVQPAAPVLLLVREHEERVRHLLEIDELKDRIGQVCGAH